MTATYTHDLVIKTGEYRDSNGQAKNRWLNVGKVFKHQDGGTSIKLDALPVLASWDGWISVYPRKERTQGQGKQAAHNGSQGVSGPVAMDDSGYDIPF